MAHRSRRFVDWLVGVCINVCVSNYEYIHRFDGLYRNIICLPSVSLTVCSSFSIILLVWTCFSMWNTCPLMHHVLLSTVAFSVYVCIYSLFADIIKSHARTARRSKCNRFRIFCCTFWVSLVQNHCSEMRRSSECSVSHLTFHSIFLYMPRALILSPETFLCTKIESHVNIHCAYGNLFNYT